VSSQTLDALVTLPGVGRKTANVTSATCVRHPGITVYNPLRPGWSPVAMDALRIRV